MQALAWWKGRGLPTPARPPPPPRSAGLQPDILTDVHAGHAGITHQVAGLSLPVFTAMEKLATRFCSCGSSFSTGGWPSRPVTCRWMHAPAVYSKE